jgi:ATP-dependent DNA ligase
MEFPTLIGEASTGKAKMWQISVRPVPPSNAEIVVTHGYVDGKKQTGVKLITSGKNIGKKNETTPLEQATLDARAQWQKKKDAGYTEQSAPSSTPVPAGGAGAASPAPAIAESRAKATSTTAPLPMLAHDFNKRGSSIAFPCYVQRKYDGTRCVAVPQVGLFSRNRKRYPHLEHILRELSALPESIILDGELYSDELTFQEIVGLVKKETLKPADEEKMPKIKFHCYDLISDAPYEDRLARLQALFSRFKFTSIVLTNTEVCPSREHLKPLHDKYVAEGYEGIMLRNKAGVYRVGVRSADLQKYKEFCDDEYEVTGFREGDGAEKGCVIWVCRTPAGQEFACRPRGTREDRVELFARGASFIGKRLTVRYQELTTDGLPRFPVGIAFRDYE